MGKNVQVQSLLLLTSMGRLFHIFYHKNKILYFLTQKRKCLKYLEKLCLQHTLGNRMHICIKPEDTLLETRWPV